MKNPPFFFIINVLNKKTPFVPPNDTFVLGSNTRLVVKSIAVFSITFKIVKKLLLNVEL